MLLEKCKELLSLTSPEEVKTFIQKLIDEKGFDSKHEKIKDITLTESNPEKRIARLLLTRYSQLVVFEIPGSKEETESLIDKACALLVCLWKISVTFPRIATEITKKIEPFIDTSDERILGQLRNYEFHAVANKFGSTNKFILNREKIRRICFRGSASIPNKVFSEGFIPRGYNKESFPTVQSILFGKNEYFSDVSKVVAFSTRLPVGARFPLPLCVCVDEQSYIYIAWLEEGYHVKRSGCLNCLFLRGSTASDKDQLWRYDSTEEIASGTVNGENIIGCFKITRTIYDATDANFPQGYFKILEYISNPNFVMPDKFIDYNVKKVHEFFATWGGNTQHELNFYQKEWKGEEKYACSNFF